MVSMVVDPIQIHSTEDIKVFNKNQASDHLYTILLSMVEGLFHWHHVLTYVCTVYLNTLYLYVFNKIISFKNKTKCTNADDS